MMRRIVPLHVAAILQAAWSARIGDEDRVSSGALKIEETTFDCDDGGSAAERQYGWSDIKRGWCCKQRGIGCQEPSAHGGSSKASSTGLLETSGGVSDAGVADLLDLAGAYDYSQASEIDPMRGSGFARGGAPGGWNCKPGLNDDIDGWSEEKRSWCCANEHVGCSQSESANAGDYDYDGGPTISKAAEISERATTPGAEACLEGLKDGIQAWSVQKREHCCRIMDLGCDLRLGQGHSAPHQHQDRHLQQQDLDLLADLLGDPRGPATGRGPPPTGMRYAPVPEPSPPLPSEPYLSEVDSPADGSTSESPDEATTDEATTTDEDTTTDEATTTAEDSLQQEASNEEPAPAER